MATVSYSYPETHFNPSTDEHWMNYALIEAEKAYKLDEVPVGAIVVHEGQIVASCHNRKESGPCSTFHAELLAIQDASQQLERWRLTGCTLYVTLEPCLMCTGAILSARMDRLVFGTHDPKAGAVDSLFKVFEEKQLNHHPEIHHGVLKEPCQSILKSFFKAKR